MLPYLQILTLLTTRARTLKEKAREEDGAGTLETVVIALGLFLVATAVVAIITRAIMSRADQIN